MPSDLFLSDLLSPSQQLLKIGTVEKFFEATGRTYSQGDSYVISGAPAALLENDTAMMTVANRVIAIGYITLFLPCGEQKQHPPARGGVSFLFYSSSASKVNAV